MKIAIIGAGYSGLTIAKELRKQNHDITIYEKEDHVGGMVSTIDIFNTKLEKYYRHIFKSDEDVINLINELGLSNELIWPSTKMGYLSNNNIYEFGTPISLLKFNELSFIEKMKFGFNVLHIKTINNYKKLEKYTAEEWLRNRIGNNVYSKIWEPLLISKFGDEKSRVSMAWLWGKIKLRSSSSNKDGEQLGYIKGSYQVLTDAFYKKLLANGIKFKLNANVISIEKEENCYSITYENDGKKETDNKFDLIISTLNYEILKKLCIDYMTQNEKEKIEKVKYTGARTMIIVSDTSFSKYYWLNIGDKNIPFGGIIEHTNFINKSNYNNNNIIYISNYMTENNKLYNCSKEELFNTYIKYLNKVNPKFSEKNVKEYYVFDEKYAQPIIECNYSKYIMSKKLEKEKIYICTMPQIYPEDRGMNYAIKLGKEISNKIIEEVD